MSPACFFFRVAFFEKTLFELSCPVSKLSKKSIKPRFLLPFVQPSEPVPCHHLGFFFQPVFIEHQGRIDEFSINRASRNSAANGDEKGRGFVPLSREGTMKNCIIASAFSILCATGMAWAEPPVTTVDSTPSTPAISSDTTIAPQTNPSAAGNCFVDSCPRPKRLWFGGEYLLWWLKSAPEPVPFITTFPINTTSATPGAIGQPDTQILLGGSDLDTQARQGGRFTVGGWINRNCTLGVEANYFFIANQGTTQSINSGGDPTAPIFAVPFIDATTGMESVGPLLGGPTNSPGFTSYAATLSRTNHLQGAELNGVYNLMSQRNVRLNLLGGFRWLQFNENLGLAQSVTGIPGSPADGFVYNAVDLFNTRNNFYGGQLGIRGEFNRGRLFVNATAKAALGTTFETVNINGSTQTNFLTGPGGPLQTLPGGVFTQPSNIGGYHAERFAVVPEGTFNVGYQIRERTRVFVGYTFLYINEVARPGNQIDRTINPTQTNFANAAGVTPSGPAAPLFNLHQSDFWAQGINFGLEFRY
jgi:hypothetical protein